MTRWLVRHLPVPAAQSGLCYGNADVPAEIEAAAAETLIQNIAALGIASLIASDLSRCAVLAALVGRRLNLTVQHDRRWRERNFGAWELRPWTAIHESDETAISKLADPDYAPPGGESLHEVATRVVPAYNEAPPGALIVTHGGPIAILRALAAGETLNDAARWIPRTGACVRLP